MPQIKIGPHFFAKIKNDYNDWKWAWVREICQNSIDAPKTSSIEFATSIEDGNTRIIAKNNGEPMTKDVLLNKLLALGESGKDFDGTIGGFGRAKEVLLFTHLEWNVRTGAFRAFGSGGDYDLETGLPNFHGTETSVLMEGDIREDLHNKFRLFCSYAQWKGEMLWNGEDYSCDLKKGSFRRDLGFGKVYTNKSHSYKLIVRINGQPMFVRYAGHDRCVVLELDGSSADVLTSNRDGLAQSYSQELSSFITELSVDKRSALKPRQRRYRHYEGDKLGYRKQINAAVLIDPEDSPVPASPGSSIGGSGVVGVPKAGSFSPSTVVDVPVRRLGVESEFVVKNETDLNIPEYYLPDSSEFSTYSQKLARIWGRLLVQLHKSWGHETRFAVGFLFSDHDVAQFEEGDYGKVYLISPAEVVEQRYSYSKSFRKRFKLTERNRVLSLAAHEFVHGLGYSMHDEDYAGKLTDVMACVMDDRKSFNWAWT